MMQSKHIGWLLMILMSIICACKKTVEVDLPPDFKGQNVVYATDKAAFSAMRSNYSEMMKSRNGISGGSASISVAGAVSADELQLVPGTIQSNFFNYYKNNIPASSSYLWIELYRRIYGCNDVLQGVAASASLSTAAKKQLTGEALVLRAFLYFNAASLFGDVPLALTTDYQVNNTLSRSAVATVYAQAISDLKEASLSLPETYLQALDSPMVDRIVPNKFAAMALLARVYLYTRDWQNAEAQATAVINQPAYRLEKDPANVFLKESLESIWQLKTVTIGVNTWDAPSFIIRSGSPPSFETGYINAFLLNAFENGDKRKTSWVGVSTVPASGTTPAQSYYYPYKYKANNVNVITEYLVMLRLAEQYLIRSEARAEMGDLLGAINDINIIRNRAGLVSITPADKASVLTAIYHERQVELFTEWGHRWFDLKRTGALDSIMKVVSISKGTTWNTNAQLYPIPSDEILINPNLQQNPGY